MFTLPQEMFMNFAAILSAIRIASFVLFVAVTAFSHFHKALIKVELVLWLSLFMYCTAAKFCLQCGSWLVYMSFGHSTPSQLTKYFLHGAWH